MTTVCLHDKQQIEAFLRGNTYLHLYEIGDLDDFFWQYTTWYAVKEEQSIAQVALLYIAPSMPVLLAISAEPTNKMRTLLRSIIHLLPTRFYAHVSYPMSEDKGLVSGLHRNSAYLERRAALASLSDT